MFYMISKTDVILYIFMKNMVYEISDLVIQMD